MSFHECASSLFKKRFSATLGCESLCASAASSELSLVLSESPEVTILPMPDGRSVAAGMLGEGAERDSAKYLVDGGKCGASLSYLAPSDLSMNDLS